MKINQCFFLIPIGLFAVFFDLRKGKIPNELIVIGLILGCCFQIRQAKAVGLLLFLGGACIPVVLGAGIYYFRMMGAGDMKLWAVVGGFLGPQRAVYCMIASLFVGAVLSIFVLLKRRNLKTRLLYFCSYIQRQQNGVWEPYLNGWKVSFCNCYFRWDFTLCRRCLLK